MTSNLENAFHTPAHKPEVKEEEPEKKDLIALPGCQKDEATSLNDSAQYEEEIEPKKTEDEEAVPLANGKDDDDDDRSSITEKSDN